MKRRQFIKNATAGAAAAAATACTTNQNCESTSQAKKTQFNWRLVMVIPKTLPVWGPGVVNFAEKVKSMSEGALNIRVFGAGELVPDLGTFDAVKAGQVEMGHSAAYYWQGKIPAAAFFTAVPFGMNVIGMNSWLKDEGQELWDELYAPHGVRAFPAGNTGLQMGGWFNKEINSPEDYKGLKMRIPGLGGKVISKAGAKPILVSGGEIYTNLTTGVIDATEWVGPYHDHTMGFHKAAKYYYYPGWHEPGPVLELMINEKAWQKLPKELQQIVETCARELDREMYAEWLAQDSVYLQKIREETDVKIKPFPAEVLSTMKKYAEEVKAQVAETDEISRKIYESFTSYQKRFDQFQDVTEQAYMKAQKT